MVVRIGTAANVYIGFNSEHLRSIGCSLVVTGGRVVTSDTFHSSNLFRGSPLTISVTIDITTYFAVSVGVGLLHWYVFLLLENCGWDGLCVYRSV